VSESSVIGSLVVWIPAAAIEVARDGALYLAIGGTILPYTGWFAALRHVDAASAGVTLFLQPLAGTLLAVLILRERPSWATLAGGYVSSAACGWPAAPKGSRPCRTR